MHLHREARSLRQGEIELAEESLLGLRVIDPAAAPVETKTRAALPVDVSDDSRSSSLCIDSRSDAAGMPFADS